MNHKIKTANSAATARESLITSSCLVTSQEIKGDPGISFRRKALNIFFSLSPDRRRRDARRLRATPCAVAQAIERLLATRR